MISYFFTLIYSLYNHIQSASGLTWGSDYYLFREGIKPMWEDENNVNGGRWLVIVDKHKRTQKLDAYWLELMMAIVGEQFEEYGDHICGAVVNVRQKGDKVKFVGQKYCTCGTIARSFRLLFGPEIPPRIASTCALVRL
jgi:translation initiation factor 4E